MVKIGQTPARTTHMHRDYFALTYDLRGLLDAMNQPPEPSTYGAAFADVYDDWYAASDDLDAVVDLLAEQQPQRVLELGVGTGRIALALARALAATGASIIGVDESPEMLAHLKNKDPHHTVRTICGDMVDDQPAGPFDLVYLSYNTLFNVSDRVRQQRCLHNIASRLAPNGRLVIDACVLSNAAPRHGSTQEQRGVWHVRTESTFDHASGIVEGLTVSSNESGQVQRPWKILYQSPQSLDVWCAAAELHLLARYASWHKTPFDDDAARHVSIYGNVR